MYSILDFQMFLFRLTGQIDEFNGTEDKTTKFNKIDLIQSKRIRV